VPISASPASRRRDGLSIPWDVIVFRRRVTATSNIEITIDRAKLARTIARRASTNAGGKTTSLFGAITAVIATADPAA
jgi:hypothetical protein